MKNRPHSGRRMFAIMAATLLTAWFLQAAIPPGAPAEVTGATIDIICYLGNPVDDNYVGSITILDPSSAGESCNQTFSVCNGKCSGCYVDADLTEDVCYDGNGSRFLRPM